MDFRKTVVVGGDIETGRESSIVNKISNGHAYIKDAPITNSYFPCGDMREFEGIKKVMGAGFHAFNLKNHGFLIVSSNINEMKVLTDLCTFIVPGTENAN